ncbi:MAG: hypothetical protein AAGK09_03880 [Planctomycetota bacterium]
MGKNIAIIVLSLALTLSLAGNALLLAALAVSNFTAGLGPGFAPPAGFSVAETYPAQVAVGDAFDLTVTVTNTINSPVEVYEIDIDSPLLNGIRVDSVSPTPTQVSDYYNQSGYIKYNFSHTIPPGQSQAFTFQCTATQAGTWTGTLDIYDPSLSSDTRFVSIDVQ